MSKRFEQALIALIKEQGSDAAALFKSFVNEHLGITDEAVMDASDEDMLSGDVEAEPDDTGLTEHDDDALLTMKTAPEITLDNDHEHEAFYLKYNEWRGPRSENEDNLIQIRTEGKCLAEIHCEMEDQYTLQIFELGGNYYGLTTTINTGEHDYYEHLGFSNDAEVQSFIHSVQSNSDESASLDEATFDDIFYHGGADVPTSDLYGNDLGVIYVTRNKKAAEYFKSQREDEGDAKLHRLVLANKKFAPEDMVVKIANDIGIDKSTYPDGTSQLFDPEFGDEEEKEKLVNQLQQAGYQGAYITDNVGFGNFRAVAFFV